MAQLQPVEQRTLRVRDLHARRDLGVFRSSFSARVGPTDARIFKFTPVETAPLGATGKMLKTKLREQLMDYKLPGL